MKWLKRLIVMALIVVAVLAFAIWRGASYVAKKAIEAGGTAVLKAETKVGSVSIGFLTSSVNIYGLRIANPEGYKTDRLLMLGKGKVACNIKSLMGKQVEVSEMLFDSPELTIEVKPGLPPKSNVGDTITTVKAFLGEGESTKFKIALIRIKDTKVRFEMIGGKTADVTLPEIEMRDIKNADGTPVMLADVFEQVLSAMAAGAFKNAKGIVPDDLLSGLGGSLGDAAKILDEGAQGIMKGVGEGVGGALKGIFGDKKKK
jgi:hypothetical protein